MTQQDRTWWEQMRAKGRASFIRILRYGTSARFALVIPGVILIIVLTGAFIRLLPLALSWLFAAIVFGAFIGFVLWKQHQKNYHMPGSNDFQIPPEQRQLQEILMKVVAYQFSLSRDRAVDLDELQRKGVLSPSDVEFLSSHSVTYKPHRRSDYHALDMFQMPTEDGCCVFLGPSGPPLKKRHARLSAFEPVVQGFLRLPRPEDELLLHIEFTEHDGMGVSPEFISFTLDSAELRQRLSAIRSVAAEFGLRPFQDEDALGGWSLTYKITPDPARTAAIVSALLARGCALTDDTRISYSAGALDEAS